MDEEINKQPRLVKIPFTLSKSTSLADGVQHLLFVLRLINVLFDPDFDLSVHHA